MATRSRSQSQSFAPRNHFLSQPRLNRPLLGPQPQVAGSSSPYDVSTVAAADFDVDVRSGFMPPTEPVARLSGSFERWEDIMEAAEGRVKLAADLDSSSPQEQDYIRRWRAQVKEMPVITTEQLIQDERRLRRAHLVLTFIMHLYVHSSHHDPTSPIVVPAGVAVPLIKVSRELGLPPVLTYADTVLWNWKLNNPPSPPSPKSPSALSPLSVPFAAPSKDISARSLFSSTPDENHFYMTSAWIELRGVEALSLMRRTLDETFLSDSLATRRIANYLTRLARIIEDITALIIGVKTGCDPAVFYDKVRPWFHGASAHGGAGGPGWQFEGVEMSEKEKKEWDGARLGGPSAGQSSLVHALDVFLGVDHSPYASFGAKKERLPTASSSSATSSEHSHSAAPSPSPSSSSLLGSDSSPSSPSPSSGPSSHTYASSDSRSSTGNHSHPKSSAADATFLQRMQLYMPRHHRAFLQYLGTVEKPVRTFVLRNQALWESLPRSPAPVNQTAAVEKDKDAPLTKAYNDAVDALKRFRDAHIRIATLYIVTQARREPATAIMNDVSSTSTSGKGKEKEKEKEKERTAPVGTGGTQLVPFLKGARDNTKKAILLS
ncbi:Indoleamine 2,3-dioxygenase [Clavulina sp. PMI_390]|nr:Indoleamine 2,3-dioxygenase [Clavulina sp. PMI_390]